MVLPEFMSSMRIQVVTLIYNFVLYHRTLRQAQGTSFLSLSKGAGNRIKITDRNHYQIEHNR